MSTAAPALLPIFRSENQLRLLAEIFVRAGEARTITELADATGIPQPTVSREVERLESAGLLRSERRGNLRLVDADDSAPFFPELRGLLLKTMGPAPALREALSEIPRIEAAWIVGSWAARYAGEVGPPPRDVDVLVVGDPDVSAVHEACEEVELVLRLDVNPIVRSGEEWANGEGGFLKELRSRPKVQVLP